MRCPKCDKKIKAGKAFCEGCGTKVADIENASYEDAVEILKSGNLYEKEKVFYSHKMPEKLERKKLLLLTIFGGFIGAHDFYVGKRKKAIIKLVLFILAEIANVLLYLKIVNGISTIAGALFLYPLASWIVDIFKVIFNKYEFPYIMEEK